MSLQPHTENETYEMLLCSFLADFAHYLPQMTPQQWDWTPDPAAPTARVLATHASQWLQCDRQHIAEPDASKHILWPFGDPAKRIGMLSRHRQCRS